MQRCDVLNAGVVHEHIKASEPVDRHPHHEGDLLGLGHVRAGVGDRNAEIGLNLGPRRFDIFGRPEAVEHDGRTRSRERPGDAESDAARRARHEGDLACQRLGGGDRPISHGDGHGRHRLLGALGLGTTMFSRLIMPARLRRREMPIG